MRRTALKYFLSMTKAFLFKLQLWQISHELSIPFAGHLQRTLLSIDNEVTMDLGLAAFVKQSENSPVVDCYEEV
jgi:hypothetical protein